MSKLQKEIAEEVNNAMERAIALEQAGVMSRSEADPVAERILSLIAEAMLSETAVETGEGAMYITIKSEPGTYPLIYMEDVPDFRTGLQAALTAAGITVAEQEGGEGE